MATHIIKTDNATIFLTCANIYKYKGFLFEFHPYLGFHQVTKNYEPRKRTSKGFYDAVEEWMNLPEVEQVKYLVAY